jgi:opacity protein-like surface antigen
MRRTILAASLLGLVAASAAQAQQPAAERMRFGAQVSFASDDVDFGVGAHLDYPMNRLFNNAPIFAQVGLDVFFPGNDVTYLELNWNALYKFRIQNSPLAPYAGAGLNFAYAKTGGGCSGDCSNSDLGLNLVGGMQFPNAGRLLPFVQVRLELGGGELFVLTGGIHF